MTEYNSFPRFPLTLQTVFAELQELPTPTAIGFTAKTIRGRRYWYRQEREPDGKRVQVYLGPETNEILAKIERGRAAADTTPNRRLCSSLKAAGFNAPDAFSGRVIAALSKAGIFDGQGLLVGSHAFGVICNVLGVNIGRATAARTEDVDIAISDVTAISPRPDAEHTPLETILMGVDPDFEAIPGPSTRHLPTRFGKRGTAFRINIHSPEHSETNRSEAVPMLGGTPAPQMLIDYLMERPMRTVLLHRGGVPIQVPEPAQFALYNLLVAGDRLSILGAESQNEVTQAAILLWVLVRDRPHDLAASWNDIVGKGPDWHSRLQNGMRVLPLTLRTGLSAVVSRTDRNL